MAVEEIGFWEKRRDTILSPVWLGQTTASLAWIASVLVVGIGGAGDWLQLLAASSWFLSNLAAAANSDG
ncbi:MAG: hypothetical protein AAF680_12985 [Pseudomonadota bacterium]